MLPVLPVLRVLRVLGVLEVLWVPRVLRDLRRGPSQPQVADIRPLTRRKAKCRAEPRAPSASACFH